MVEHKGRHELSGVDKRDWLEVKVRNRNVAVDRTLGQVKANKLE